MSCELLKRGYTDDIEENCRKIIKLFDNTLVISNKKLDELVKENKINKNNVIEYLKTAGFDIKLDIWYFDPSLVLDVFPSYMIDNILDNGVMSEDMYLGRIKESNYDDLLTEKTYNHNFYCILKMIFKGIIKEDLDGYFRISYKNFKRIYNALYGTFDNDFKKVVGSLIPAAIKDFKILIKNKEDLNKIKKKLTPEYVLRYFNDLEKGKDVEELQEKYDLDVHI